MQTFQKPINEDFFIGMCDRFPGNELPKGLFQYVQNARLDNNSIEKRPGTSSITTSLGAFSILGLSAFEPAGGTKYQIACRDGTSNSQLYSSTGGNFSSIGSANLTAGLQMNFVQASNYLFGFNGMDEVDVDSSLTVTKNRATIPLGKFGYWFHNYLFVAGVAAFPNRLYFSNLGVPITFTGSDYIDINANDGDVITGLSILNDELLIFKNFSVWSISGWSGSSFGTATIAGQNTQSKTLGTGTPSHQSIISTGRDVYYLSFAGGIPHFRSLTQTVFAKTVEGGIVSFDIENTMNGINKAQLAKCAGVYDGKYISWSLPNGASTTNNLSLIFEPTRTFRSPLGAHRSWVIDQGYEASQFAVSTVSGRPLVYFGDAGANGLVFKIDLSLYTDNGDAVVMDVQTRDYSLDVGRQAKWKYVYHRYQSGSAGTLQVLARINQTEDFNAQEDVSLLGDSPGLGPTGTFTLGVSLLGGSQIVRNRVTLMQLTGALMGLEFLEETSNFCQLYDFAIYGDLKGLRNS